ncbi:hypothetical protein [Microbulbifer discodermiae]|uniref:hypothetical protein n=1 Tax=Microbulbifer sp. 2201CG32-9 TaxID=3232309 RepID=UPI00345B8ECF
MKRIAVASAGYVGLSKAYNGVTALDLIPEEVSRLNNDLSPIADADIGDFLTNGELNFLAKLSKAEAYNDARRLIIMTFLAI